MCVLQLWEWTKSAIFNYAINAFHFEQTLIILFAKIVLNKSNNKMVNFQLCYNATQKYIERKLNFATIYNN